MLHVVADLHSKHKLEKDGIHWFVIASTRPIQAAVSLKGGMLTVYMRSGTEIFTT